MTVKRFIAGAVCPRCGAMDTLRVFRVESGQLHRECVDCQFSDSVAQASSLQGAIPETRIAREEKVLDDDVEIVRLMDE